MRPEEAAWRAAANRHKEVVARHDDGRATEDELVAAADAVRDARRAWAAAEPVPHRPCLECSVARAEGGDGPVLEAVGLTPEGDHACLEHLDGGGVVAVWNPSWKGLPLVAAAGGLAVAADVERVRGEGDWGYVILVENGEERGSVGVYRDVGDRTWRTTSGHEAFPGLCGEDALVAEGSSLSVVARRVLSAARSARAAILKAAAAAALAVSAPACYYDVTVVCGPEEHAPEVRCGEEEDGR